MPLGRLSNRNEKKISHKFYALLHNENLYTYPCAETISPPDEDGGMSMLTGGRCQGHLLGRALY